MHGAVARFRLAVAGRVGKCQVPLGREGGEWKALIQY